MKTRRHRHALFRYARRSLVDQQATDVNERTMAGGALMSVDIALAVIASLVPNSPVLATR